MAGAIEKNQLLFTTGYFMRTHPQNLFLKEQVAAGSFGKITRARGSNCHSGSLGGWFDTEWRWMADPAQAGCGAFGDLGTHVLDILLWLMGDVERVAASIGRPDRVLVDVRSREEWEGKLMPPWTVPNPEGQRGGRDWQRRDRHSSRSIPGRAQAGCSISASGGCFRAAASWHGGQILHRGKRGNGSP